MKQWLAIVEFRLKKMWPWLVLAMIGQTSLWFVRFLLADEGYRNYFWGFAETRPYLTILGAVAVIHLLTLLNPMAQRLRLLPMAPLQLYSAEFVSLLLAVLIGIGWIDLQYMYFGHYERSLTSSLLYFSFIITYISVVLLLRYLPYMWLRAVVAASQLVLLIASVSFLSATFLAVDEMKIFVVILAIVTLINVAITLAQFQRAKGVWR